MYTFDTIALHWPFYLLIGMISLTLIGCIMLLIGSMCSVLARDSGLADEADEEDTTFTGTMTMWFFLLSANSATLIYSVFLVARNISLNETI